MTLTEKIEKILAPAINVQAPYAREMVVALTLLIGTYEPSGEAATEADRELLMLLRQRVAGKLFIGMADLNITDNGNRYAKAGANTSGVGLANFITSAEQEQAFNDAFKQEAIAARPYIYALERELIKRLAIAVIK